MPKISVILPLYNGMKFINESIQSIQNQSYLDWELIIVNDHGSNDGCADIVIQYSKTDSRIRLIQNEKRLGLADSLNVGISAATGEYIARVDVDDPSYPERFAKQVEYLDNHPDVALCGTLQRSVLPNRSYVEEVPSDAEELKAALLFDCEISHCSVMFRRELFLKNGWKYDGTKLGEDYDLWTRIMFSAKLVNMPEVLVDHRWGFDNISIDKGESLRQETRETSARVLEKNFGIKIEPENQVLLSGWRSRPEKYALRHRSEFIRESYQLLCELEKQNEQKQLINPTALQKIIYKRWNWVCKTCGLFYHEYPYDTVVHEDVQPAVSIVLPVYGAVHTLRETLDSILTQKMENWELLVVCEHGNHDGSTEIARMYAKFDRRIRVIENEERLGLAESLNVGIGQSRAKYIARIDADDLMNAERLSTQAVYMDKHPKVGVTQFYQHYFGERKDNFIHRPPVSAEAMKAKLLFFCDACHSTVMMRKSVLEQFDLYYQSGFPLEDYDLWVRLTRVTAFETIPEVYGEYRVGLNNITSRKNDEIQMCMCRIVAEQLQENLSLKIPTEKWYLLNGWYNIFLDFEESRKALELQNLQNLLREIWGANERIKYYDPKALLMAISAKWRWAKYDEPWEGEKEVSTIETVLELSKGHPYKEKLFRYCIKKPLSAIQRMRLHFDGKVIEHQSQVVKDVCEAQFYRLDRQVERWTWERFQRTEKRLTELEQQNRILLDSMAELQYCQNRIPYISGEKIRIVFLFQIASFWPSWESFYRSCMEDERIDAKFVFLDETGSEKSQMLTAHDFLVENKISYINYNEFDMEQFAPHVLVMQTPYDRWHRKEVHWANIYRSKGYRIVYIPYGVEISDTEDSHKLHFESNVIRNCWRIYTFSEVMKNDYSMYCINSRAVRVLGLPRFDSYKNADRQLLPEPVERRRKGRPVILWKVHFPKVIWENGKRCMITPELKEYLSFSEKISHFSDFFFIFMPHPKFREMNLEPGMKDVTQRILDNLSACENVWLDDRDDYRASLMNADFIIVDRSAIMVEAGAVDVPVLYMTNQTCNEPITKAILPLINSYYQGNCCTDMVDFIENCRKGWDPNQEARRKAFQYCIPMFDGKAGERIKENVIEGVVNNAD